MYTKFKSHLLLIGFLVAFGGSSFQVEAQTVTPAQLEQLQKLTPEQKEQIFRLLGSSTGAVQSQTIEEPVPDQDELFVDQVEEPEEDEDRLKANDSVVVKLSTEDPREVALDSIRSALGKHVYALDSQGYLHIPGVTTVLLAGLTVEQAKMRLEAESRLRELDITVHRLPVVPVGSSALQRYGADLFQQIPTTFAPSGNIPVPLDFVVGPGDSISLLIYGQQNVEYSLNVNRDGIINIPEIGPVTVAGMRYEELKKQLEGRIKERYIGVEVAISMGELRSIQVFVVGDVNQPGSYTVSSLTSVINAIFVSGGVAENGSMRSIQLKRNNRVVGRVDLYDFLLNGNTRRDLRLRTGDVIYVPPIGKQASIYGHVTRPAIYELKGETDLKDLITMAGGFLPSANRDYLSIERYIDNDEKSLIVASADSSMLVPVKNGDMVEIAGNAEAQFANAVSISGHVVRESNFQWRPGLRLLDVLPGPAQFKPGADQNYLVVRRLDRATGRVSLMSADWRSAFESRGTSANLELRNGDQIFVFDLGHDRSAKIEPLLDEVKAQSNVYNPTPTVAIQGRVRSPGEYPLEIGMRVSDLIRASGLVLENAYLDEAELTRLELNGSEVRTSHITVNLVDLVEGSASDILLQHTDVLTIKEIPLWREHRRVKVSGEIEFPGIYSVTRGERLSSVIDRAGGLTRMAFPNGSVFLREALRERERKQLDDLQQRLSKEVSGLNNDDPQSRERGSALLKQLDEIEAAGRLVIDLNLALSGHQDHDVILEDGDELVVPSQSQEVTVIGEVQYPTSHIFEAGLDHLSYIGKSGGATRNSDVERVYVIRANGNVSARGSSNWFRRPGRAIEVYPGDTIVVPFDADKVSSLTLWSSVSQVIYNIGVAAAAVASF